MGFVGDRGLQDEGIGAGRPIKFRIDYDELCRMMQIQCTQEEIAYLLGCTVDTLHNHVTKRFGCNYMDMYKLHSSEGKKSLRRVLFDIALEAEKDADRFKAAQWLSKQHLGMKDQVQTEIIPMQPYCIRSLDGETIKLGSDKAAIQGETDDKAHSDTLRPGDNLQP
jgi:hypothetical protein